MFRVNTPEENAMIRELNEKNFKDGNRVLDELKETLGLEELSTLEELGLTPEQVKKISWIRSALDGDRYFSAVRPSDGELMKALVRVSKTSTGLPEFGADIFSPADYAGHGGNHDFNKDELSSSLQHSIKGKKYPA